MTTAQNGSDPVRLESPRWIRASVPGIVAVAAAAVALLLVARRWVDLEAALAVTAVFAVLVVGLLGSPDALVIGSDEVRTESGWRRIGFRIPRESVFEVRWDADPDIFEPPRLTFLGPAGEVVREVTVEFDPRQVLGALRRFGWPIDE